ncbi:MAG: outer membrane protein assembly factor BamD, partial [Thermoanaerobaculia bacterium]
PFTGCAGVQEGRTQDPLYSEWREGIGWRPAAGAEGKRIPPASLRAASHQALQAAAHRDALRGFLALRDRYPDSPEAKESETSYAIAECYYHLGESEYASAYTHYLEVLKGSPREEILKLTLGRIYDIGRAFLDGRAKRSFLGISYRSPSYGVEILLGADGLVTNYPFYTDRSESSLAENALMEVARYYFQKQEYAEAELVFDRLIRDYPASVWSESAEYQLALSVFRQVRGVDYDQEALRKARSKFNAYLSHHPRGSHVEEAREFLRRISEMEGEHDLRIARYYLRESQPQAAMLYLSSVMYHNPRTEAAREAREIFENMEKRRGGR